MTISGGSSAFPIPADLKGFWQWDKMHCPKPQTALTRDLFNSAVSAGFSGAMDELSCPVGVQYTNVNTYAYMAVVPFDLGQETMEHRVASYKEKVGAMLPRIGELWEKEWLPSIIPALEASRARDYSALSDQQLIETLDQMYQEFVQRYRVHGRINFAIMAASLFVDYYNEQLSPEDPTEAYEALQGFDTRSVDAGRGLWTLGRMVRNSPVLRQLFERYEPSRLIAALEGNYEGHGFLSSLRDYLEEFGWRSEAFELSEPTWRENPVVPLNAIQGYMNLDESHDPNIRFQQAVDRREELLANARQALAAKPELLERFNQQYEVAKPYANITEDHNFYIDQIGNTVMRLPVLEMGRRLVQQGSIAAREDVFHLTFDEIKQGFSGAEHKPLVTQRKAELDQWSRVVPTPVIGDPPPQEGEEDPLAAALGKFFGVPPEPSRDPDIIQGLGASPGTVQGTAKVVRSLNEASKLVEGDIMVCEMTMPPWTPLFSIVSAVVADTGGPLSHCAIVSREYRIPCVVGTVVGTSVIRDGMKLTVDGAKGIVRIDSRG